MPWPFAKFIVESSNGGSVGHQLLIRNIEGHSTDLEVNNMPSFKTKGKVTAQTDDEETAGKKSVLQGQNMPLNGNRTTITTPLRTSEMPIQEPKTGSTTKEYPLVFGC
jgi:agmatine/peptidylarginine deiminase